VQEDHGTPRDSIARSTPRFLGVDGELVTLPTSGFGTDNAGQGKVWTSHGLVRRATTHQHWGTTQTLLNSSRHPTYLLRMRGTTSVHHSPLPPRPSTSRTNLNALGHGPPIFAVPSSLQSQRPVRVTVPQVGLRIEDQGWKIVSLGKSYHFIETPQDAKLRHSQS